MTDLQNDSATSRNYRELVLRMTPGERACRMPALVKALSDIAQHQKMVGGTMCLVSSTYLIATRALETLGDKHE